MGAYCKIAKEIAFQIGSDGVCAGLVTRSGNGVLGKNDEYGKQYVEFCPKLVRGRVMNAVAGATPAIVYCEATEKKQVYHSDAPNPPASENVE